MPFKHTFFAVFLTFIAWLTPLQAHALDVESVRFGLHQDKTRLVLDLDEQAEFRAFVISEPYRLVIDLPAFEWKAGEVQEPKTAGVLATRYGNLQPGISRIVFDLNRPISVQKAFTLPEQGEKPSRLVIDFANVSASLFQQIKSKTYGNLDPNKPRTQPTIANTSIPKPVPKPSRSAPQKPLVIIDPGHGGIDPGAIGAGLREKNVVFGLARALKDELEGTGRYRVKMTRTGDTFIKLSNRVKFSREHDGDLFISIHADSLDDSSVSGASVYTLSETASDAQTAKLAARENKADLIAGIDLSTEDDDVANILMDLAMRETMNQSKFFAGKLVKTFPQNGVKLLSRPHRHAGFAVLKAPDVPSILVEAGFMSNKAEAKRLNTPDHRRKFARAMRSSIDAYFEQVRKNRRL